MHPNEELVGVAQAAAQIQVWRYLERALAGHDVLADAHGLAMDLKERV